MAEVDTLYLSNEHSAIRKEAVDHTNEIVKEGLKGDYATLGAIKDSRHDIADVVGSAADRLQNDITTGVTQLTDRFFTVGRDTADLRAQVTGLGYQVRDGFVAAGKDAEIQALKTQMDAAKNTTYLSDKIGSDGDKTRALIVANNDAMLNRLLIERNSDLASWRHSHGRVHDNLGQAQWQGVANQMAAFQSQLQETRQGMVNFGTMAGVGQSSTSNNVR